MQMNNVTVARKLWALLLGVNLLLVLAAVGVLWNVERIKAHEAKVQAEHAQRIALATRWKDMATTSSERVVLHVLSGAEHVIAHLQKLNAAQGAEIVRVREQVQGIITSPEEKAQLERIEQVRAATRAISTKAQKIRADGDAETAMRMVEQELLPSAAAYKEAQEGLVALMQQAQAASQVQSRAAVTKAMWWALCLAWRCLCWVLP